MDRPVLTLPDPGARADLADFAARVVRLDLGTVIRLQATDGEVAAWAQTTFDVLTTLSVPGTAQPADLTVIGNELLAALAVERSAEVDPGTRAGSSWRGELPPRQGWAQVGEISAAELDHATDRSLAMVRESADLHGAPAAGLLDQAVLSSGPTTGAAAAAVQIPLRCLLAIAGMALSDGHTPIRVAATPDWLRLDAAFGAVIRQRRTMLPILATR